MAREGYVEVSTLLRSEEAEMLRALLESAGIEAVVEGEGVASLALPRVGASILVREADAARAREIVSASGLFGGAPEGGAVDIDEAEWRAVPEGLPVPESPARPPEDAESLSRRALGWAIAGLPLCFTLVVPVYAHVLAARVRRAPRASRAARARALVAARLAMLSLLGGAYVLFALASRLRPFP